MGMPVSQRERKRLRAKEVLANIALVIASIAVTLVALELTYHVYRGPQFDARLQPDVIVVRFISDGRRRAKSQKRSWRLSPRAG